MIIQHHLFLKVRRYDHCDVRHTTSIAANNTGSDGGEHTLANDCRCLIHKRLDDADELGICRRLQQKPGEGAGISLLKVLKHTQYTVSWHVQVPTVRQETIQTTLFAEPS